ncbi:uncharacterized protein LOC120165056 [Hibiscus syriacus]|uniref:uncharacterized protein LOC120165056 n=1 Tax=Hibiscus syriacus TaxID=106335 RepID=UPI0019208514|nr:uncharacterized protein LOC120165056 [Hibiscus syriacus]
MVWSEGSASQDAYPSSYLKYPWVSGIITKLLKLARTRVKIKLLSNQPSLHFISEDCQEIAETPKSLLAKYNSQWIYKSVPRHFSSRVGAEASRLNRPQRHKTTTSRSCLRLRLLAAVVERPKNLTQIELKPSHSSKLETSPREPLIAHRCLILIFPTTTATPTKAQRFLRRGLNDHLGANWGPTWLLGMFHGLLGREGPQLDDLRLLLWTNGLPFGEKFLTWEMSRWHRELAAERPLLGSLVALRSNDARLAAHELEQSLKRKPKTLSHQYRC